MQTKDLISPPGNQGNLVIPEEILKRLRASSSLLGIQNNQMNVKESVKNSNL
jgi:hypothetical protein